MGLEWISRHTTSTRICNMAKLHGDTYKNLFLIIEKVHSFLVKRNVLFLEKIGIAL